MLLTGKMITNKGAPLTGALILLKTTGVPVKKQYTNLQGAYAFDVPTGSYALIPVASEFWVYSPCYQAVRLTAPFTMPDFVATPSNEIVPVGTTKKASLLPTKLPFPLAK